MSLNSFFSRGPKYSEETIKEALNALRDGVILIDKNNCFIDSGTTVGSEGFGIYKHEGKHLSIPHIGKVIIEDDVLIAVGSDGFHSNGYSLIRKILKDTKADLSQVIDEKKLLDHLLTPTRIYTKTILDLIQKIEIKSIAHITGGGIIENIPRTMPKNMSVTIDTGTWNMPPIFNWLSEQGNINQNEMFRTFNCGIGLVLCVNHKDVDKTINFLSNNNETAWKVGKVIENNGREKVQFK